jgi:hypothetical protein
MYFSRGCRSHSTLSFYYNGLGPAADQQLNLYVDDALYATYGNTYDGEFDAVTWTKVDIVLRPARISIVGARQRARQQASRLTG